MFEKIVKLEKWKKQRLVITLVVYLAVCIIFLLFTCGYIVKDNKAQRAEWKQARTLNSGLLKTVDKIGARNHTPVVTTGTYVENVQKIDLKANTFDATVTVWFRWKGHDNLDMANDFRIYKGVINNKELVADETRGNTHYQKVRVDLTLNKNYDTPTFPLDAHQLRIFIEPNERCDQVMLKADSKYSTLNPYLDISGYHVTDTCVSTVPIKYTNTQNDPALDNVSKPDEAGVITTEVLTSINISRSSWGTYIKCFIALFATLIWVIIMLYLSTVHEIDPLGMIPGAFFGAVSNILVGANLLPDALETGLIEFVNIWGIMNILCCAMMIISINSIRNRFDEKGFARFYGRIMFYTMVVMTALGNILLPVLCVV